MTTDSGSTPSALQDVLRALSAGAALSASQVADAFGSIMRGEADATDVAALLLGLRARGESAEELAGVVQSLRAAMITVEGVSASAIDTCGTGGGRTGTFNVSTAAAIVATAAGAVVAKHGNRSYTSRCGSADVLEALGIPMQLDARAARAMLDAVGMTFLFAPTFHPAMRHLAPVRKALGVPTIMNLVGPLANPARVRRQVIGVADLDRAPIVAAALARLGTEHALVVHAEVGMDEIAPHGVTRVWEVRDHSVASWTLDAGALGHGHDDLAALAGGDPADNAARLVGLLADPDQDPVGASAVILNAGAAVYVAGLVSSVADGIGIAEETLRSGKAAQRLRAMQEVSTAE
ncbi:MAG: anthranilate phosphoribosyltransferase [Gemmatimonadales bacterium]